MTFVRRQARRLCGTSARRAGHVAVCACAIVLLAGCVTEKSTPPRGVRVNPDGTRTTPQGATVPTGQVASPVPATLASTVRLGVRPVGSIPYDTQCIPLISPDGRYAATQVGPPPSWATLWATDDAESPSSTVEAYSIGQGAVSRIEWPERAPDSIVLGRSANDEGFLVESVQVDGSRAIAQIAWASGRVEMLAQDSSQVFAHGTFTARGELAFTSRGVDLAEPAVLCLRSRDGSVSTLASAGGSYAYPMATSDDRFIYALCVRTPEFGARTASLEVHAIRIDRAGGRDSAKLGSVAWSYRLGDATDPAVLHQFAAAVPQPGPLALTGPDGVVRSADANAPLAIFRPGSARVHVLDMDRGRSLPLPATTVSAAWLNAARLPGASQGAIPGFLCTTSEGLLFLADPRRVTGRVQPIRLLSRPYLARPLRAPDEFVLLGPVANAPDRLEVVHAKIGTE